MASPNTLKLRNSQPRIRRTLCGPHDRVTIEDGKENKLVPICDKPFIGRNGTEYVYTRSGSLRQTNGIRSRRDRIRLAGGKKNYNWLREAMI